MTSTFVPRRWRRHLLFLCCLAAAWAFCSVQSFADDLQRVAAPNYKAAAKFSTTYLRQYIYDTAVTPHWIGKTDLFWYSFKTSSGTHYYRVNPKLGIKEPLFDQVKLGALLTEMVQKPMDPAQLPLQRMTINEEGTKLKFVIDDFQYEYDLLAEKVSKLGKAPPVPPVFQGPPGSREDFQRRREELLRYRDQNDQRQQQDDQQRIERRDDNQQQNQQRDQQQNVQDRRGRRGQQGFGPQRAGGDYRNFSPDRSMYVFAKKHNLYLVEVKKDEKKDTSEKKPVAPKTDDKKAVQEKDVAQKAPAQKAQAGKTDGKVAEAKKVEAKPPDPDKDAVQLTTDGVEDYSFGGGNDDRKARPFSVTWSKDSKAFYVIRTDTRGVQELYLINSLATPRPTLEKYKYPMPGEEAVRKNELYLFDRTSKKLTRVQQKWKDERHSSLEWGKTSEELRFTRTDRLGRHGEYCSLNTRTGECKCLIAEGFENAHLFSQPPRYLDDSDEMIWWSERSGWGHYYLYERSGKLKNAITSGPWRASRIMDVDTKHRVLYFTGNAREPGENLYQEHLYCVHFDGTGLTLKDPGNANHRSTLSPSRQFTVDNCSRIDLAPLSVVHRADGKQVMVLEHADLSKLKEIGWKLPEMFTVKAADGVTDLYGNMWKPFDFDAKKKYPIIAHVYPGPQMEGTTHTFTPAAGEQQLAQLGFIVIQVGNRGGTPMRSKAYASHGYYNLRDYGLEDKKAAIEQLAARHAFIDIDRVGIYGHSGGGFMTAAAMLQKPYNEFFKAGVSSSGNHDNNVYNDSWAETYHGLKEIVIKEEKKDDSQKGITQKVASTSAEEKKFDPQKVDAQKQDSQKGEVKKDGDGKKVSEENVKTKFEIHVPTNAELAPNLKGHLLLVHGDLDNNVHPAGTMRLVDALIKANKRFDMLIIPGKRHGYADYQPYFQQRMFEYFAQHLLGDYQAGADILEKGDVTPSRR